MSSKPTVKEIEEYMASLNIPMEQGFTPDFTQGLNGTTTYDIVRKPKHYMLFEDKGIEVRDVLEVLADKLAETMGGKGPNYSPLFISDYVQLMQYLMRFMDKNGKEDLEKARWYLDKMIQAY